jgi:hypothetical protein
MGLAGSLIVGLLELFASHGQNRFYRELEEWVSSITRLGFAGAEGEAPDQAVMTQILDHVAAQIEVMQTIYVQSEASRAQSDAKIADLAAAVHRLSQGMEAESGQVAALNRLVAGQDKMIAALATPDTAAQGYADAESRMRLRSIDVQLLRILEELSAGRQETVSDLRGDLAALTAAFKSLARGNTGRG